MSYDNWKLETPPEYQQDSEELCFTESDMHEAVAEERRECAAICESDNSLTGRRLAARIRARGEK